MYGGIPMNTTEPFADTLRTHNIMDARPPSHALMRRPVDSPGRRSPCLHVVRDSDEYNRAVADTLRNHMGARPPS